VDLGIVPRKLTLADRGESIRGRFFSIASVGCARLKVAHGEETSGEVHGDENGPRGSSRATEPS
jgi:hypothetical protein